MNDIKLLSRSDLISCIELGKAMTSELDSDKLFRKILIKLSDMIPAEIWSLLLVNRSTGELRFRLSVDLDVDKLKDFKLAPGEGIAGQVARTQKPMAVPDVKKSDTFSDKIDRLSGVVTKSIMCVPLLFGGETVGVIEAINPHDMSRRSLSLLKLVADYAAIAVENTHRYRLIQDQAVRDNLTGLYNTRFLYRTLDELREGSKITGDSFSVVFMDLDNFKNVVDTFGHLNGSQAIQEVADTIKECLVPPAFGVSYGGDEFVVVLPDHDKKKALAMAEEIRGLMKRTVYLSNKGLAVSISASFGVATYPDDAVDCNRLLCVADRAMFNIKGTGKGAVGG